MQDLFNSYTDRCTLPESNTSRLGLFLQAVFKDVHSECPAMGAVYKFMLQKYIIKSPNA